MAKATMKKRAKDDTVLRHEQALKLVTKAIELVGAKNVKSFVDELESERVRASP